MQKYVFKVLQLCLIVIMECSFDYLKCLAFGKYIEKHILYSDFLCGCMIFYFVNIQKVA